MNWEISILEFLEGLRVQPLNKVVEAITFTAEGAVLLVIIATFYWCVNKEVGLKFGFMMMFSTAVNGIAKNIVKAPRPFELGIVEPLRKHTATGYSFPSGHTQGATTFWVAIIMYIKEKWIYYVGVTMIILVALSRLYLGVHWPVDVIAAVLMGVIFALLGEVIFRKIEDLSDFSLLLICLAIASTLLLKFDSDYTKSIAALVGLIIGLILERRYVGFNPKASFRRQLSKMIIGFGGLIIVAAGLKLLLPGLMVFVFIRYALMAIWIIAGAPYLFQRLV